VLGLVGNVLWLLLGANISLAEPLLPFYHEDHSKKCKPIFIGNVGQIIFLMLERKEVIPTTMVWYEISLINKLSGTYPGWRCGASEFP